LSPAFNLSPTEVINASNTRAASAWVTPDKEARLAIQSARLLFARNIRLAREELGMSQEDMAEACGLHRTYVGSVERGERNISIDNMEAMARAVKKHLPQLLVISQLL